MSSEERKKGDVTNDTSECNKNTGMEESSNWKMAPQLIISDVTSNTQDRNLTDSVYNISTSGPHGRQCYYYYGVLNEVLDMTDLVNPNYVRLCSADFSFLMNPNEDKKDRYIGIVSNMLYFLAKCIFSANQAHAASHFYNKNPCKLGGKQRLVITDGRESRIFISDRLYYLPVRCPTDEYMES